MNNEITKKLNHKLVKVLKDQLSLHDSLRFCILTNKNTIHSTYSSYAIHMFAYNGHNYFGVNLPTNTQDNNLRLLMSSLDKDIDAEIFSILIEDITDVPIKYLANYDLEHMVNIFVDHLSSFKDTQNLPGYIVNRIHNPISVVFRHPDGCIYTMTTRLNDVEI